MFGFFSASAVASDNPPEGCMAGGAMYETKGGTSVDGPASAFVCPFRRAPGVPYGWNRKVGTVTVLVEPLLC